MTKSLKLDPQSFEEQGYQLIQGLLNPEDCTNLIAGYEEEDRYRSTITMARHGFGQGEYRYFRYPLPDLVAQLRCHLYPQLVPLANHWNHLMGLDFTYPEDHQTYLDQCHQADQTRPTPLILKYGPGDYNCLHQDKYGPLHFPLQLAILLSRPGEDFTGGEFMLTEQRPRMQSRGEVVPLTQGDAVIFPVAQRPRTGTRGSYRVTMRHGVSRIRSGSRYTLGIIFHDAL